MAAASLASIMRDQVALSITSFDRLYLGGYVPTLQTSGQLVAFCQQRLGMPIASPALFGPLTERFTQAVHHFAEQHEVPVVHFARGQRKDEVAAGYRARFTADEGVVFIGIAQEKMNAFGAHKIVGQTGRISFDFSRRSVAVTHMYFYVHDAEWGPAFIKVGTYLPYPVRIALNGHEWAKQQLKRAGIPFQALDNGFRWCADPTRLQAVCDALGPADVQAFFTRWVERLPWPLSRQDRAAGYRHRWSLWQVEVSLTHIFREPLWGRCWFETVNPRKPRPGSTRSGQPAVSHSADARHTATTTWLPHARDRGRGGADAARRLQAHRSEAVSEGRLGLAQRDHLQRPDRRPAHQGARDVAAPARGGLPDQHAPAGNREPEPGAAGSDPTGGTRPATSGQQRVPRTFRYTVARDGLRLAFGLSRIYLRLLQPDWAALHLPTPEVPEPLRAALHHLDLALHQLLTEPANPLPTAA